MQGEGNSLGVRRIETQSEDCTEPEGGNHNSLELISTYMRVCFLLTHTKKDEPFESLTLEGKCKKLIGVCLEQIGYNTKQVERIQIYLWRAFSEGPDRIGDYCRICSVLAKNILKLKVSESKKQLYVHYLILFISIIFPKLGRFLKGDEKRRYDGQGIQTLQNLGFDYRKIAQILESVFKDEKWFCRNDAISGQDVALFFDIFHLSYAKSALN